MPKMSEDAGNSIKAEAELARRIYGLGESLWRLDGNLERLGERGIRVTAVKILPPSAGRGECLIIVNALSAEGKIVAFVGADDTAAAFRKLAAQIENGSIKWRLDNDERRA